MAWALVGPVAPRGSTCSGLEWSGAGTAGSGSEPVTTDATFTTGPVALTAAGCYAWTDVLSGTFPGVVTIPPGSAGEVTQISLHQPSLVTQAAVTSGNGGSQSLGDSITATNSGNR